METSWDRGEALRVRMAGKDWVKGTVVMVSLNGLSLAISVENPLGPGGVLFHPEFGVVVMLSKKGDGWEDVASGDSCEVERSWEGWLT